jgi:hypothetical protein
MFLDFFGPFFRAAHQNPRVISLSEEVARRKRLRKAGLDLSLYVKREKKTPEAAWEEAGFAPKASPATERTPSDFFPFFSGTRREAAATKKVKSDELKKDKVAAEIAKKKEYNAERRRIARLPEADRAEQEQSAWRAWLAESEHKQHKERIKKLKKLRSRKKAE